MQEVEQGATGSLPKGDWRRKMGTEEGAKELRDTAEEKANRAPYANRNMNTKGSCPGDPFRGPATGYRSARPSKP